MTIFGKFSFLVAVLHQLERSLKHTSIDMVIVGHSGNTFVKSCILHFETPPEEVEVVLTVLHRSSKPQTMNGRYDWKTLDM